MENQTSDREEFDKLYDPKEFGVSPPVFKKSEHKSFAAEVAIIGKDLVFHFYLPQAFDARSRDAVAYWDKVFGNTLSEVAMDHFKATYPRLRASHIQEFEIDSWWMRAYGFLDEIQDVDGYVRKFYDALDARLTS